MAQVKSLAKSYQALKVRLGNVKEKSEKVVKAAVHSGEAAGTAALFGYLRRKKGGKSLKIGGVPVNLGVAVAGTIGGFMDVAGMGDHLQAIATGALCTWAYEEALGNKVTKLSGIPSDEDVAAALNE